jgi:hypothetical protein
MREKKRKRKFGGIKYSSNRWLIGNAVEGCGDDDYYD